MDRMRMGGRMVAWLVLLAGVGVAQAGPTRVTGRVVDAAGAPAAGVEVGTIWDYGDGKIKPFGGAKTDADGKFSFEAEFYGREGALIAIDADRKTGGLATVDPAKGQNKILQGLNKLVGEPVKPTTIPPVDPVEIRLGPLVRVHGNFDCPELDKPVGWTNVYMMLAASKTRIAQCSSKESTFDLKLPAGSYLLNGYGSDSVKGMAQKLELKADQPDLDLATIHLAASPLGKMYGKEPPPLHITDARGISKDIKLSDFRGKWVIIDFWGYWCGPCVSRGLPDLMEIWDEHPESRDKFVILAFHDKQAADFAQLDAKMKPIIENTWGGRELPFPILLDATGETVREYGIQSWPTSIAINPEGIVVPGGEYALAKTLPEVPAAQRIPRALDKQTALGFDQGTKLDQFAKFLGQVAHLPIRLDEPALKTAGIAPDKLIPLDMSAQVSLRSWLEIALKPLGLVAVPGPDGLIVTTPKANDPVEPSAVQRKVAERLERLLDKPTSFDFTDRSLTEITGFFEEQTAETFILDPADRRAGRLDPKTTVSGRAEGVPLRDALKKLLAPLGMEAVVRDEVVVLSKPARP